MARKNSKSEAVSSVSSMKVEMGSVITEFANVYWFEPRNFAREKPSTKREELKRLLKDGWNPLLGTIPVQLVAEASTAEGKDYVAMATAERQAQWDSLRTTTDPNEAKKLKLFETMYVRDGKIIPPVYIANACFQRGLVYFEAQFLRAVESNNTAPPLTTVPVLVRHYESEKDRLQEQLLENEGKLQGSEPISDKDRLRVASRLFDLGLIENRFRTAFSSDTTGQKLFSICKLNRTFPGLRILERLLSAPGAEGYINYGPLVSKDLVNMKKRLDADKLAPGEKLTNEEEVSEYLARNGKKTSNDPKMMSKNEIAALAQSPIELIRDVSAAITTNNSDFAARYLALSVGLNALVELSKFGAYPEAERWLVDFLSTVKSKANPDATHGPKPAEENPPESEDEKGPESTPSVDVNVNETAETSQVA